MEIDRGLKIRLVISAVVAVLLLGLLVERLSYRSVAAEPRKPAAERLIESCDQDHCNNSTDSDSDSDSQASPLKPEEGALFRVFRDPRGA
jgi:hypothetical protein